MGHRDMIWSRHQPAQLLAWGIRFFLAAALTATQTPGDYAPFALGCVAACGPGAGGIAALLGAAAVGWHREGVWQQQGQLLLCRQHQFHLHQLCVFHPDTCFAALQSPWAVTVQRANLTLVFPGKEKVTVRSVPLAALDFLEI